MLVPRALLPPDTALGGSTLVMSVSVPVPLQASSLPSASGLPSPPPPPAPFSPLKSDVYLTVPIFNRRADLLALTISFMAFSWICSVLRLYVRLIVVRAPGWDDLFMTLALICTSVCSITLCIAPDYGFGKSMYALTLPEVQWLLKMMYIGNFAFPLSITFIKIALLFQYLRIFNTPGSRLALLCKVLIGVIILWGLALVVINWVPCVPVQAFWDKSITDAWCWGIGSRRLEEFMAYFVAQAVSTAALDFVVFVIPAHLYFRWDTPLRTRVALLCLFGMGIGVNFCSFWRMGYVIDLERSRRGYADPTWYSPTAAGLANIEAHLAVACASLPIFWPSLEKTWNKIFVTHEVSVTTDYGQLKCMSRAGGSGGDVELQSISSDKNLTLDPAQMPEGWEPFVGDETTGLGESETVIESTGAVKRPRLVRFLRGDIKMSETKLDTNDSGGGEKELYSIPELAQSSLSRASRCSN